MKCRLKTDKGLKIKYITNNKKMAAIILNQEEYILADDLFENAPVYCKMIRNSRELMKKKKITDYIYARFMDDKWDITNGKSNKFDKVLIKKAISLGSTKVTLSIPLANAKDLI
jgi:hypothetical protein